MNKSQKNKRFFIHDLFSKNRKGSHVGVVLSFTIFIAFLIFLYPLLIKPAIDTNKGNQYLLDELKTKLTEKISAGLTISSVEANTNTNQDCIELKNFISGTGINSNIIVKNNGEKNQQSYVSDNSLRIDRDNNSDVFFKIIYSEEFENLGSAAISCEVIQESNYEIGLVRTEKRIFETKIINLTKEYKNNYESLKTELGLVSRNEFDFRFTYNNKTSIGTKKEASINIYAEESPIQYVNKQGDILLGNINVRIW